MTTDDKAKVYYDPKTGIASRVSHSPWSVDGTGRIQVNIVVHVTMPAAGCTKLDLEGAVSLVTMMQTMKWQNISDELFDALMRAAEKARHNRAKEQTASAQPNADPPMESVD
jgi:hypothetical protein